MDLNGNGLLDRNQLVEGLKSMGIHVGIIGNLLILFDRDTSGQIDIKEWQSILGEDVDMEEVDLPAPKKPK